MGKKNTYCKKKAAAKKKLGTKDTFIYNLYLKEFSGIGGIPWERENICYIMSNKLNIEYPNTNPTILAAILLTFIWE